MDVLDFLPGHEEGWGAQLADTTSASTSILSVRRVIDILSPEELDDEVILSAIRRAAMEVLNQRVEGAPVAAVRLAILHRAAYLSYESYSDRVTHQLAGVFDSEGVWNPVASVVVRETQSKLKALKDIADAAVRIVTPTPSRFPHFSVLG